MKYLVIETINTRIDACLHHESGVATCWDGGDAFGVPWTFVQSGLFDNYEEAKALVDKLYYERFKDLNEFIDDESGWIIATTKDVDGSTEQIGCTSTALFLVRFEPGFTDLEWLYKFDILEIDT